MRREQVALSLEKRIVGERFNNAPIELEPATNPA
jgi:hypothetical protein